MAPLFQIMAPLFQSWRPYSKSWRPYSNRGALIPVRAPLFPVLAPLFRSGRPYSQSWRPYSGQGALIPGQGSLICVRAPLNSCLNCFRASIKTKKRLWRTFDTASYSSVIMDNLPVIADSVWDGRGVLFIYKQF
jgi:hypothetical protein